MKDCLQKGERVNWKRWNKEARIVELNSRQKKARIVLTSSSFQTWVPWNELQASASGESVLDSTRAKPEIQLGNQLFQPSLDLHGKTVEEGLAEVEAFLQQAYVRNITRIEIIHGEGTGKLRNAVRDFLKGNSLVNNYDFAHPNLGGLGVTIVYLNTSGADL